MSTSGTEATPAADRRPQFVTASVTLAVIVVVLLGVVAWRVSSQTSRNKTSGSQAASAYLASANAIAAQQAATSETRAALSYNYKTLAADFATAEKGMTAQFKPGYRKTVAQDVTPLATSEHASSVASVSDAGVSALSATTATVLVFVDQTVQNDKLSAPRLDRTRIKVAMTKLDGRWLINNLSPI